MAKIEKIKTDRLIRELEKREFVVITKEEFEESTYDSSEEMAEKLREDGYDVFNPNEVKDRRKFLSQLIYELRFWRERGTNPNEVTRLERMIRDF